MRGAVDVHLHQIVDAPEFFVDVDRIRAAQLGLTEQQVAQNLNTSLSSSFQVSPNFWTDPASGIPYQFAVQTPEYRTDSISDVENTPLLVSNNGASPPNLLSNVATLTRRGSRPSPTTRTRSRPTTFSPTCRTGRSAASRRTSQPILQDLQKQLPPGNTITVRGQILSKDDAFANIGSAWPWRWSRSTC